MNDKINKESVFDFSDDEDEQITTIPPIEPTLEEFLEFFNASDSDSGNGGKDDHIGTNLPIQPYRESVSWSKRPVSMTNAMSSRDEKLSSKRLSLGLPPMTNNFKKNDGQTQSSSTNNSKSSDIPPGLPFEYLPTSNSMSKQPVDLGLSNKDDEKESPYEKRMPKRKSSSLSLSMKRSKSMSKTPSDILLESNSEIATSSSSFSTPPPPRYFSANEQDATNTIHANPEIIKPLTPPSKSNPSTDESDVELGDKTQATKRLKIIEVKPSSASAKAAVKQRPSVKPPPRTTYYNMFGPLYDDISSENTLALTFSSEARQQAQAQIKTQAQAQAQAQAPAQAPFHIVLVNIKIAAEEYHIYCEKKPLDGKTPPYVALSYRWGELDEQMVPATKDYNARISSFQLLDFFKLCQAMCHEPDLQQIEYVWVDAICVNQEHLEKRKETIYRMNDIYIHATTIVAVPDLHATHLSISSTANHDTMAIIEKYRCYLYYLLVGTSDAQQTMVKMDHAWMDAMGVPAMDVHRRDVVMTATAANHATKEDDAQQHVKGSPFIQNMMALMLPPTSLKRSMPGDDHHDASAQQQPEHDQQLPYRMMVEFQRLEWQQKLDQRKTDIIKSMEFLQSIMEDWSNRTWVISEYHIAKRKTGKLKFWYNQLSCPELHGLRFFEFNFTHAPPSLVVDNDGKEDNSTLSSDQQPFTSQIIYLTRKFNRSMHRRLTKRTVLEMMLQTKASKHEDRFHSIIPLAPKYKHHIKDRHSISRLGISDMLSVRLQLMAWMDTKDRLMLVFCKRHPLPSRTPLLPTFASHFKAIQPGLMACFTTTIRGVQCNFDLTTTTTNNDIRLYHHSIGHMLWLSPRVLYLHKSKRRSFYQDMGGQSHPLWASLGLDPARDPLEAVSIPLFLIDATLTETTTSLPWYGLTSDLQVVGSREKNIWLVYPFCSNYKEGRIYPSQRCTMKKDTAAGFPNGFRIF